MDPSPVKIQHVHKASSDKLLLKFADSEPPPKPEPRKLALQRECLGSPVARRGSGGGGLVSLLPPPPQPPSVHKSAVLRRLGIRRSELGAMEVAGIGFLLATFGKTWRKTVHGASKMFAERHCKGHVRLINDVV
ncbi:hypothetical protein QJS10_CPA01g00222 [Acorus calamus]|uniref:Uncharacterized protein n=1 Tax=Acorus calamus TaxID=4465 RepID=A0AAV9FMW4_ACOCL|nr:hypothetical protein QJS10_CPA01g00222 [Acorus calamus]